MSGKRGQKSGGHNRKTNREKEILGVARRRLAAESPPPPKGAEFVLELDGLDEAGRLFYEKTMAALKANGTMGDGEELALHVMARRLVDWCEADAQIRKYKRWLPRRDKDGNVVGMDVSAFHKIERELWQDLLQLQREYGRTPLSRDQIRRIGKKENTNEFAGITK